MNRKLSLFAVPIILTGCFKTVDKSDWTLYQPDRLILSQGTVVDTVDGKYSVQNIREVWHSTKIVDDLERRLISK